MTNFQHTLNKVDDVFKRMDQSYRQTAAELGFVCAGCEENCCRTLFHHHTLIEYLYLREGLSTLPTELHRLAVQRAAEVLERTDTAQDRAVKRMCPLNIDGRCIVYAHRPMICRLHGIPHSLRRPDGLRQVGPGCADFDRQYAGTDPIRLDRTPLYAALAELERELRQNLRFTRKLKMTIAQMITETICIAPAAPSSGKNDEIHQHP